MKLIQSLTAHKVYSTTTKTSAGHSGSSDSGDLACRLHHQVEFEATDLVVVPQRSMGVGHEPLQFGQLTRPQRGGGLQRPFVLGYYVAATPPDRLGQALLMFIEVGHTHVSQRRYGRQHFLKVACPLLTF